MCGTLTIYIRPPENYVRVRRTGCTAVAGGARPKDIWATTLFTPYELFDQ